jgi:hypothetical protein
VADTCHSRCGVPHDSGSLSHHSMPKGPAGVNSPFESYLVTLWSPPYTGSSPSVSESLPQPVTCHNPHKDWGSDQPVLKRKLLYAVSWGQGELWKQHVFWVLFLITPGCPVSLQELKEGHMGLERKGKVLIPLHCTPNTQAGRE